MVCNWIWIDSINGMPWSVNYGLSLNKTNKNIDCFRWNTISSFAYQKKKNQFQGSDWIDCVFDWFLHETVTQKQKKFNDKTVQDRGLTIDSSHHIKCVNCILSSWNSTTKSSTFFFSLSINSKKTIDFHANAALYN